MVAEAKGHRRGRIFISIESVPALLRNHQGLLRPCHAPSQVEQPAIIGTISTRVCRHIGWLGGCCRGCTGATAPCGSSGSCLQSGRNWMLVQLITIMRAAAMKMITALCAVAETPRFVHRYMLLEVVQKDLSGWNAVQNQCQSGKSNCQFRTKCPMIGREKGRVGSHDLGRKDMDKWRP